MYFARFDDSVFDWAFEGGIQARRRSFVFGYGHLIVFAALAAVGVGVRLAIEEALGGGAASHAAAVLGVAVASAALALSVIQRAAPASLSNRTLAIRSLLVAAAVASAFLGDVLSAPAVMAVLSGALVIALVAEAVGGEQGGSNGIE
jgi:low temperature requirement protein LtrA